MKDDCIFCKLANGVFPTNSIYEDECVKVILDAGPATKGHALVIPKEHYQDIFDIEDTTLANAMKVAKKVAARMQDVLNCDGVNIVQNNKEAAGQTVPHFHIHVIPRYKNDGQNILWDPKEPDENEQKALCEKLKF
ncbi:MAG: HIT family protein [Lachnospiraceae bacterium]|jgi:histidine triad (HIT) family protein|nr:HIT family protein [Lachnospiraceae bacterium]MBR5355743.1 HIT family protein [Lachnospiraceae bacterium]